MARAVGDQRSLQRAMALNPNSVEALQTYATGMMRSNRTDEAREVLEEALVINPESLPVLSTTA